MSAVGDAGGETTADRFRRVAAGFAARADAVPEGAWSNPAPCAGWTARDVVHHLVEWVPSVIGRSGVTFPSLDAEGDPAGAWRALAATLQAALDDPAVATRTFDVGPPGEMSVEAAIGMIVLGDVLVHTWDLARATGQDETVAEDVAAEMLAGLEPLDEMLRASGHYGPRVDVPADAGVVTRLIAFTGRDPR